MNARDPALDCNFVDYRQKVLVYRRYASLYFAVLIDNDDNPLLALNTIHLVVEALDRYFKHVAELDLIFNFWKVIQLLDEIVLGGELVEASKPAIMSRMALLDRDGKDGAPGKKDKPPKKTKSVKPKA